MALQMTGIKSDPPDKYRDGHRNTAADAAMAPAGGVETRGL
jgi:hypothetical protein